MRLKVHSWCGPYKGDHTLSWSFAILPGLRLEYWSHQDTDTERFRSLSIVAYWLIFGISVDFRFGDDE